MQEHHERYIEINREIAKLEEEKKEIAGKILSEVEASPEEKLIFEVGSFSKHISRKWAYPEYVKKAEIVLKAEKTRAENNGDATCEISKSVQFYPKKEGVAF